MELIVVLLLIIAYFATMVLKWIFQVYHTIGRDRMPLRRQYLEAIVPPFVAVLRRWRPLLAGIHELATADGMNPLIVDDRTFGADSLPVEVTQHYLFTKKSFLLFLLSSIIF